ncbi:MAG: hypothetical protein WC860_07560 [Candidatus Margulisiibacteriota bacterium]|jgi:hypothetical protein
MKRFFILTLFIVIVSLNYANAASKSGTLKLQLKVNSIFDLSLNSKSGSTLDFGIIQPGQGYWGNPGDDGLSVICQTNLGEDWSLNIQTVSDFIHEDQISTMPCSLLQWMCTYAEVNSSKLDYAFAQFNPISINNSEVYNTIKSAHSSKNGYYDFKVKFMFGPVPPKAKPGKYSTNIIFTMTQ